MTVSVNTAAKQLFAKIQAPLGSVNTLVERKGADAVIVVYVDPQYRRFLGTIPSKYQGYSVKVENRPAVVSNARQYAI